MPVLVAGGAAAVRCSARGRISLLSFSGGELAAGTTEEGRNGRRHFEEGCLLMSEEKIYLCLVAEALQSAKE